jgi:hypothetical protein
MDVFAEETEAPGGIGFAVAGGDACSFEEAIAAFEEAIAGSCGGHEEWPARVVAGIGAAVEFVAAEPAAARALAVDSRWPDRDGASGYESMIDRFAGILGSGAPRPDRLPETTDESVVSVIASIVSCHVRTGTVDRLEKDDPNLIFLALLPYLGFAEANRWSAST